MTTNVTLHAGHDVRYFTGGQNSGGCAGAMSYYTAAGQPPGEWAGKGAAALGLAGQVDAAVIERLLTAATGSTVLVAPAGAGKSHTMAVFARLWTSFTGRRVVGLTGDRCTQAAAAEHEWLLIPLCWQPTGGTKMSRCGRGGHVLTAAGTGCG